jgi:raffinose/stachyose/melibiose transport system substrate-binding protein
MKMALRLSAATAAIAALAAASLTVAAPAQAASCGSKTEITMLGTIKPEIQDQFLAAVDDYNSQSSCYHLTSIPGDRSLTFLQNVTPLYAAHTPPTIMYTLQEIPNMADKVVNWDTYSAASKALAKLVPANLKTAATIGGHLKGVPSTVEAFGLLYNKTVLDAAGVKPADITTRAKLEAAFKAVNAYYAGKSGKLPAGRGAVRFSSIWWSLGAHFSNIYFTNAAKTHEGRLKVLDAMADGKKNLAADPVFQNYIATFNLLNKYNQHKPNTTDTEYSLAAADLAAGKTAFWFMGNWAEPTLLTNSPESKFGVMPLPISNDPKAYGNDSISVGVPGYFMIDNSSDTTDAQRNGAIDFLTWLYTSSAGQHHVVDSVTKGGMGFIPVYNGTKVKPATYMSQVIAKYVGANKVLDWMNTFYPAGGQDLYGASGQKLMAKKITATQYAKELQNAWKGVPKTWRGESAN